MESLTTFLALWGAVLSTVAIVWNIWRGLLDRGRIRVEGSLSTLVFDHRSAECLVITGTNVGRRPVTLTGVGWTLSSGSGGEPRHMEMVPHQLPQTLEEGDYVKEWADDIEIACHLRRLWMRDSVGREWHASRRNLRQLRQRGEQMTRCEGVD